MNEIVAQVNGSPISRYEYNTVIQEFALGQGGEDESSRPERAELEKLAFERLVARELIYLEALAAGVVADEQSVMEECQRAVKGFRSEKEFMVALDKAGGDPLAFQRSIRKDVTVAKMSEQILADISPPDEEAVADFYHQHPQRLQRPACYALRQLLLPSEPDTREEMLRRIEDLKGRLAESSFVELIRDNSECPSAMRDGELRDVRIDQMAPEIKEVLDALAPGEVGGPVETASGFHLLERLDYVPERIPSLDECRVEIEAFLLREYRSNALAEWVSGLQKEAQVEKLKI